MDRLSGPLWPPHFWDQWQCKGVQQKLWAIRGASLSREIKIMSAASIRVFITASEGQQAMVSGPKIA